MASKKQSSSALTRIAARQKGVEAHNTTVVADDRTTWNRKTRRQMAAMERQAARDGVTLSSATVAYHD